MILDFRFWILDCPKEARTQILPGKSVFHTWRQSKIQNPKSKMDRGCFLFNRAEVVDRCDCSCP